MNKEQIKKILHDEFIEKHGEKIYNVIIDSQSYVDDICKKAVKEGIERFQMYQVNAWEQQKKEI